MRPADAGIVLRFDEKVAANQVILANLEADFANHTLTDGSPPVLRRGGVVVTPAADGTVARDRNIPDLIANALRDVPAITGGERAALQAALAALTPGGSVTNAQAFLLLRFFAQLHRVELRGVADVNRELIELQTPLT